MIPAHMLEARSYKIVNGGEYGALRHKTKGPVKHMALDLSTRSSCRLMLPEAYAMGLFLDSYRTYSVGRYYANKIEITIRDMKGFYLTNEYLHTAITLGQDDSIIITPVNEGEFARKSGYWTGFHIHVATHIQYKDKKLNINPASIIGDSDHLQDIFMGNGRGPIKQKFFGKIDDLFDKFMAR
jgi:hypothetical protein